MSTRRPAHRSSRSAGAKPSRSVKHLSQDEVRHLKNRWDTWRAQQRVAEMCAESYQRFAASLAAKYELNGNWEVEWRTGKVLEKPR